MNTDNTDEYAEYRDEKPPENAMQELQAGIQLLIRQDKEVEQAEALLKAATARRNKTRFVDLPAICAKLGNLEKIDLELPNGDTAQVKCEKKVRAALSEGRRDLVVKWMKENGYAHHISNDVVIPFTKGQEKDLAAVEAYLKQYPGHVDFSTQEGIHPATYTAFCAKLKKDGIKVDDSTFGITIQSEVKVKVKSK